MKTHLGRYKKLRIFIFIFLLVILLLPASPLAEGAKKVPDFTIKTAERRNFTLSEQNKPVVIEFMTPLCTDCKKVEENLKDLYPEYKDDFIFLSIDISESSKEELKRFKEEREIPWIVGQGDARLFQDYQGVSVPKVVMIDSERYLTYQESEIVSERKLGNEMDEVIKGESDRRGLKKYGIFGIAILGGVSSFFSPCSFPLLPSYIAYYLRSDNEEKKKKKTLKGVKMGIKASLGLVLIFGVLGSLLSIGGTWISYFIPYLQLIVGVLIFFLGVMILAELDIRAYLPDLKRIIADRFNFKDRDEKGYADPFFYGLGYGAASAGCTAPVFLAVLLASWISEGYLQTVVVLLLYLLTMVVLMLAFSLLTVYFREEVIKKFNRLVGPINRISGIVMMIAGIYLIYYFSL